MKRLAETLKWYLGIRSALLFILIVAFCLRLPGLGRDLWYDETWSLFNARGADVLPRIIPNGPEFTSDLFRQDGGWRGLLLATSHAEYTPTFYFLVLRLWIKMFGESNRTFRLLSVLFGVGALLATFFLGRKLFDEKVGLIAVGVLALLPLHIQFSIEVRAYALTVLLTTLASSVYWSALQAAGQHREWRYWFLYSGLAAASLHTHYFTAGIFVAHGLFALIQPRPRRGFLLRRLFVAAVAIFLLMMPWLLSPYFKNQLDITTPQPYVAPFWDVETLKRVPALVCYLFAGFLPGVRFKSLFGLAILSPYAISGLLVLSVARHRQFQPAFLYVVLLVAVPVLFIIGLAALIDRGGLLAQPKFILPIASGFSLLLGAAMRFSRRRSGALVLALIIAAFFLHFQVKWYSLNQRSVPPLWSYVSGVSAAVKKVNQKAQANDLIVFTEGDLVPIWNVYDTSSCPQLLMGRRWFFTHAPLDFESRWREVERTYSSIYLIHRLGESANEVIERLGKKYYLRESDTVGGLEIRHYVKRPLAERT